MNTLQIHDRALLKEVPYLIGVDEAGRGALAGPVVAAACVLGIEFFESADAVVLSQAINDSKQLSAKARETQYAVIEQLKLRGLIDFEAAFGSVDEIAQLNILGATRLAMQRSLEALSRRAVHLELPVSAACGPLFVSKAQVRIIIDGRPLKPFDYAHEGIVKGDATSLSIAMAGIVAKVTRDREMLLLAEQYPHYNFEKHKGYGTKTHRDAILASGPCPVHRALFLRKILGSSVSVC